MEDFNVLMKQIGDFFAAHYLSIIAVAILLVVGGILITLLAKLLMKIIYSTKIDNASGGFFVALLKVILWIALIFGCVNILGINGNSFLVAFSSVALAIGLALKDSLSNIANGLIIVVIKPFKKGDYVAIGSNEGTIKKISILTTELVTPDNKKIVIPNSIVISGSITNYSANPTRRLDATFSVSYSEDMDKVMEVLLQVAKDFKYSLDTPAPRVMMVAHGASSVDFKVRIWVNNSDYWDAYFNINKAVWDAFAANGIEIPFQQIDLHIKDGENNEKK